MAFAVPLPAAGRTCGQINAAKRARPSNNGFSTKAVAAPELSPEKAGTAGAKNQLDALKQMSKIVADSGVSNACYMATLPSTCALASLLAKSQGLQGLFRGLNLAQRVGN